MPDKCCVPRCTSGYKTNPTRAHFFSTKKVELQQLWTRAIHRANFEVRDKTTVCHLHFHEDDIIKGKYLSTGDFLPFTKWSLKEDAVPKILPNCPAYLSKKPTKQRGQKRLRYLDESELHGSSLKKTKRNHRVSGGESFDHTTDNNDGNDEEQMEHETCTWKNLKQDLAQIAQLIPCNFWVFANGDSKADFYFRKCIEFEHGQAEMEKCLQVEGKNLLYYVRGKRLVDLPLSLPLQVHSMSDLKDALLEFDSVQTCTGVRDSELLSIKMCKNGIKTTSFKALNLCISIVCFCGIYSKT